MNRECGKFKLSELTPDKFKGLIFVQGLTTPKDAEIRVRLLSELEQDSKLTLQNIAEECQRIINLRHDTVKLKKDMSHIHSIEKKEHCKRNFFF